MAFTIASPVTFEEEIKKETLADTMEVKEDFRRLLRQ